MSDPVTNTDREDVLSSIRRMVSDTPRPSAPDRPGRLVLTPDIRVAAPEGQHTGGAAAADPSATSENPGTPLSALDDRTLTDEDALRDLVAELVREELQGQLGERITRNVRKLVRSEIQRALAAHNLS